MSMDESRETAYVGPACLAAGGLSLEGEEQEKERR